MGFSTALLIAATALFSMTYAFHRLRKHFQLRSLPEYHLSYAGTFAGHHKIHFSFHPKRAMNKRMILTCPGFVMIRERELSHGNFSPEVEIHCSTLCDSNKDSRWPEDILFKPVGATHGRPSPKLVADTENPSF